MANQEVLRWLLDCHTKLGDNPSDDDLAQYAKNILASGKVIPGYGHAVLREVDPRFTIQIHFGDKFLPNNTLFKLVMLIFSLIQIGKAMLQSYTKSIRSYWKSQKSMAECRL